MIYRVHAYNSRLINTHGQSLKVRNQIYQRGLAAQTNIEQPADGVSMALSIPPQGRPTVERRQNSTTAAPDLLGPATTTQHLNFWLGNK